MTYHDICQRLTPLYGPQEAKAMTRMLLEDLFSLSFADILCGATEHLSDADTLRLQQSVARLLDAEPLQYVTGTAFFCGHPFHVAPGVLIPRPETEWIVDTAVGIVTSSAPRILDIGTGSGCIATSISLALADRHCYTEAWDISEDALRIAADNAERLGADVKFRRRDALRLEEEKSEEMRLEKEKGGAEVLIADNASLRFMGHHRQQSSLYLQPRSRRHARQCSPTRTPSRAFRPRHRPAALLSCHLPLRHAKPEGKEAGCSLSATRSTPTIQHKWRRTWDSPKA